ncbi:FR47-like protein [Paenibacillus konkukensis]|uniref:FR47-like protein n=1 Tax=Paenibacillus konkukensis TaxID=2020716 RepID=A0ABY4S1K6_9BACL|nr:GNAT family N-acetyltransferase [Paenibacillus konkukensis]UQZ87665.1 FR47-like protein [Paenibacillus konkukensis]
MKLWYGEKPEAFLRRVESFLENNEAVNNLLLGLLHMLVKRENLGMAAGSRDTHLLAVEDDHGLALVVLLNDKNAVLYADGERWREAVLTAAADLFERGLDVPGVVGPPEAAKLFAEEWARLHRYEPVLKMNQRIYRLDRVVPPAYCPGRLKAATMKEHELVAGWIREFVESIGERIRPEEASNKALEFIRDGSLHLWHDGEPVSMAKSARPTKRGIVLSYVYTPPQYRRRGYASSCVAALSGLLLEQGYSFCSLYTDLANPTSNHIYSQIGYRPVQDSVMYRFR